MNLHNHISAILSSSGIKHTIVAAVGPTAYVHGKTYIAHADMWGNMGYKTVEGIGDLKYIAKNTKEPEASRYAEIPEPDSSLWIPTDANTLRKPSPAIGHDGDVVLAFYLSYPNGKPAVALEKLGISDGERSSHSGVNHPRFDGVKKYLRLDSLNWKPLSELLETPGAAQ